MEINHYLDQKRMMQSMLIDLIVDENNFEENYENLIKLFKDLNIGQEKFELQATIYLILNIANNHHRSQTFFSKIEIVLLFFKENIKQTFTNSQIFTIFKSNKRILLFLIKEGILVLNQSIVNAISKCKYLVRNYHLYFASEIKTLHDEKIDLNQSEFDEKRKIGENDNYICRIIRNDLIEEFIIFINKTSLPLSFQIEPDVFETNNFLLKRKSCSMIEYAAFFGSTQIFKYLYYNNTSFDESIWLFAIHGDNPELIQFLNESKIKFSQEFFDIILNESIKCHHNEIIRYFQMNNMDDEIDNYVNISAQSIKYSNYCYFPNNLGNGYYFYFLCKYNFISLVKILMNMEKIDNEAIIILNMHNFNQVSFYKHSTYTKEILIKILNEIQLFLFL